ncbi:MAG: hypothetical protein H0V90_14045 [Blastocatellia bacterium]|nr:hypothetical protein [Blastocatellia bacterium]
MRAVKKYAAHAKKHNIEFALVGGIAMHFYGGPRLTKDVDIIASEVLPIEAERRFGFGGERYRFQLGGCKFPMTGLCGCDEARGFYEKALEEAYPLSNGLPIVTAEWLIILKYIAGRFKDQQDAVFLLKQKGLVNRKLIRKKITDTLGPTGWAAFAAGLKRWYLLNSFSFF